MRFTSPAIAAILLFFALAAPAGAAPEEIMLVDGTAVRGEILEIGEKGVKLRLFDLMHDEEAAKEAVVITLPLDELDGLAFYILWAKQVTEDAQGQLRLAAFAFERGYPNQAKLHYRLARALDPERVKKFEAELLPKIEEDLGTKLLATAKRAQSKGDHEMCERALAMILTQLPGCSAAEEARAMVAAIHIAELERAEEERAKAIVGMSEDDAKAAEDRQKVLDPYERWIRTAQRRAVAGLRTRSSSQARGKLESAANNLEGAIQGLDALAAKHAEDATLKQQIAELRALAVKEAIEAHVNIGSMYLIRRDYNSGLESAQRALSLDGDSQYAREFQQRVVTEAQYRPYSPRR